MCAPVDVSLGRQGNHARKRFGVVAFTDACARVRVCMFVWAYLCQRVCACAFVCVLVRACMVLCPSVVFTCTFEGIEP